MREGLAAKKGVRDGLAVKKGVREGNGVGLGEGVAPEDAVVDGDVLLPHELLLALKHEFARGKLLAEEEDEGAPVNSHVPRVGHHEQPEPVLWHAPHAGRPLLHADTPGVSKRTANTVTLTPVLTITLSEEKKSETPSPVSA